jgi:hypothetical protein
MHNERPVHVHKVEDCVKGVSEKEYSNIGFHPGFVFLVGHIVEIDLSDHDPIEKDIEDEADEHGPMSDESV